MPAAFQSLGPISAISAYAVSDDGLTIVGTGRSPAGSVEAWRVTVPAGSQ